MSIIPVAPPVGLSTWKSSNVRPPQVTTVLAVTVPPSPVPLTVQGISDAWATLSEPKRIESDNNTFFIEILRNRPSPLRTPRPKDTVSGTNKATINRRIQQSPTGMQSSSPRNRAKLHGSVVSRSTDSGMQRDSL